jgi:hypothetical protein
MFIGAIAIGLSIASYSIPHFDDVVFSFAT